MSARLFSSPVLAAVKRSGVRFQSTAGFAAERDAVKHHAEGVYYCFMFTSITTLLHKRKKHFSRRDASNV
jgi:hypothetical protein